MIINLVNIEGESAEYTGVMLARGPIEIVNKIYSHVIYRNTVCKHGNIRLSVIVIALFTVSVCPQTSLSMLKAHILPIGRLEQVASFLVVVHVTLLQFGEVTL